MITRCPKCDTSFRITVAQLETAKGAVRCGSCLQVFQANEHLVEARPKAQIPAAKKPVPTAPAEKPNTSTTAPRPNTTASAAPARPAPTATQSRTPASASTQSSRPLTAKQPASAPQTKAAGKPLPTTNKATSKATNPAPKPATPPAKKKNTIAGQQNVLNFDQSAIDEEDFDTPLFDDDMLISDEMSMPDDDNQPEDSDSLRASKLDFGGELSEGFLDLEKSKVKESSLFDHDTNNFKDDEDNVVLDESWAEELLDDIEEDTNYAKPNVSPKEKITAGKTSPPYEEPLDDDFEFSPNNTGSFDIVSDDVEDMLGEPLAEAEEPVFDMAEQPGLQRPSRDKGAFQTRYNEYGDESYDSHIDYVEESNRRYLLDNIEPEPVDLGGRDSEARKRWLWRGGFAAALLILCVQVTWLQFDRLSRKAPYRNWYAALCSVFPCEVPAINDKNKILATNLVVRDHPSTANALIVDTVLLNTAEFAQPFPDLVLAFSNSNNKIIAYRRFRPDEYLGGELAGQSNSVMPTSQPIHLSIEIIDPGADAIGYTAYIP